ncbi:MAG TPA: TrkA C-terminal domain-containing protein [Nitriliruptoraceae bacterium]|nr:TrkA C-terminal domain-containing protein [Nitriliruptoraceae bacterium]
MGHLNETALPGIGQRVEFTTDEGRRVGVVQHHTGRREVFVCSPDDPDRSQLTVRLSEDEAHSLVESLGVLQIDEGQGPRTYEVEGLVFEWLEVEPGSPTVGHSIADLAIRTRTGASVVAVLRESGPVPAPEPEFVLDVGDTLVVAGTTAGVDAVRALLQLT